MKIIIRVDSSLEIGTGHVMRCLTLADTCKKKGTDVQFICRDHPGNLIENIQGEGYIVHVLEAVDTIDLELDNVYWLGTTQEKDANECHAVLQKILPDWLIVDHYAIDYIWQSKLKGTYQKLMVIDDLADRQHYCDLLLDQTFGRKQKDYQNLVSKNCQMLLGSEYALLRPEFSEWRVFSLRRRAKLKFKRLLVTMGGVDPNNFTGQVLEVLKQCDLPKDLEITIILGGGSLHLNEIKKLSREMPWLTQVKIDVTNMAEIMSNSDLSIGAAGTTTWERCCVGLPCIQLVIADNQITIADALSANNAVRAIRKPLDIKKSIVDILPKLNKISLIASFMTQGGGAKVVVDAMISKYIPDEEVKLVPVTTDDSDFIYSLQTIRTRKYFRNTIVPSQKEHQAWYQKIINSSDAIIFLISINGKNVGMLRIDGLIFNDEIEVSVIVMETFSGQGYAKSAVQKLLALLTNRTIKSIIHKENIASKRLFENIGFIKIDSTHSFDTYEMPRMYI